MPKPAQVEVAPGPTPWHEALHIRAEFEAKKVLGFQWKYAGHVESVTAGGEAEKLGVRPGGKVVAVDVYFGLGTEASTRKVREHASGKRPVTVPF